MTNAPIVAKVVALVVLFVATVVGCHAHFNNVFKEVWDMEGTPEACKAEDACPSSAMPMEVTFVAFTIICLILSTGSLVAGFLMDMKKFKGPDAGYHGLAGVLLLVAGILMIVAAIQIDVYIMDSLGFGGLGSQTSNSVTSKLSSLVKSPQMGKDLVDDLRTELRKELKFYNKLAGGGLAFIDGILYFVAAGLIARS